MKLNFILILMVVIFFNGCSNKGKLSKLLVLKNIGKEQDSIDKHVKQRDKEFEKLILEAKQRGLAQYSNKQALINEFGDPVLEKSITIKGKDATELLYRYETKYFSGDKVYFYFDEKDELITWKYYAEQEKVDDKDLEDQ